MRYLKDKQGGGEGGGTPEGSHDQREESHDQEEEEKFEEYEGEIPPYISAENVVCSTSANPCYSNSALSISCAYCVPLLLLCVQLSGETSAESAQRQYRSDEAERWKSKYELERRKVSGGWHGQSAVS